MFLLARRHTTAFLSLPFLFPSLLTWTTQCNVSAMDGAQGDASSMYPRVVWYFALPFFYLVIPFVFISLFAADKQAYTADIEARYVPGTYLPIHF